ncbi:MAG: anti-sigma factor RsbA family regulatory protein [Nocardioidaceae bacterium]
MQEHLAGATAGESFVHEAFFYDGDEDFVAGSVEFLSEGLSNGEHVVVVLVPEKIEMLRAALRGQADQVTFIDMAECGRNPARVIQVWADLMEAAALRGSLVRGLGEPIWPGRSDDEIVEGHLHEALLNAAFPADARLLLRCPYDVSRLDPDVVRTAERTHPVLVRDQDRGTSRAYAPDDLVKSAFLDPLSGPVEVYEEVGYGPGDLSTLRAIVAGMAVRYGMPPEAVEALVLSVREIAVNSIRHGGGSGRMRAWVESGSLVCELSDAGHIHESMVGRLRPRPDDESGRGLWLANQLCDLVQIRSSSSGTVVRLHVAMPSVPAVREPVG